MHQSTPLMNMKISYSCGHLWINLYLTVFDTFLIFENLQNKSKFKGQGALDSILTLDSGRHIQEYS